MNTFSGNTSSSALSTAYDLPYTITSWSIVNKSGGSLAYSVSIIYGSTNIYIANGTLSSGGEFRVALTEEILLAGRQIYVLVNGSSDYYFSIK